LFQTTLDVSHLAYMQVMTERREEDNARVRLAEELERVRKQMAEEAAQRAAVAQQAAAAAVAAAAGRSSRVVPCR
jgi:L-2-hydroxyglutarate oxidase LhgO